MRQALDSGSDLRRRPVHAPLSRDHRADHRRAGRALLTTSCTHALEMAALLLDIQPGDEVDLSRVHVRLDDQRLRAARGAAGVRRHPARHAEPRRAPARGGDHAAHQGDRRRALRRRRLRDGRDSRRSPSRHGIPVVEDNAHGFLGAYDGRPLGSFGALATLSFHETKNITCGEGGALLINDARFVERAEILREKGTNRSRFFRGEVDKYTWVDVGSSYLPSDLLAAFLFAQLEAREAIQRRRHAIWATYAASLAELGRRRTACGCPWCPSSCRAPRASLLPADAVAGGTYARCIALDAGAPDPDGVPLSAAASLGDGAAVRWRARPVSGHRRRVPTASCGCRSISSCQPTSSAG